MSSTTSDQDAQSTAGPLRQDLTGLLQEVQQMGALRWELVSAECRNDVAELKRFAKIAIPALVIAVVGLSLLAVAGAYGLSQVTTWSWGLWALTGGLVAALGGALASLVAYRRFRRQFTRLRDSVAEVKEDLVWIQDRLR